MTDTTKPSGARRVAAFLLTLDKDAAASILQKLDPAVVADVAEALTSVDEGSFAREVLDEVWRDLAKDLHAPAKPRAKKEEELAPFLEAGLGKDRARQVLGAIHERRRHDDCLGTHLYWDLVWRCSLHNYPRTRTSNR